MPSLRCTHSVAIHGEGPARRCDLSLPVSSASSHSKLSHKPTLIVRQFIFIKLVVLFLPAYMAAGVSASCAPPRAGQCSQPISPWRPLSSLRFQCVLLPCDSSFLVGVRKSVTLWVTLSFLFIGVETMILPALYVPGGSGIMFAFLIHLMAVMIRMQLVLRSSYKGQTQDMNIQVWFVDVTDHQSWANRFCRGRRYWGWGGEELTVRGTEWNHWTYSQKDNVCVYAFDGKWMVKQNSNYTFFRVCCLISCSLFVKQNCHWRII